MNRTELREKLNKIDCDNCNKYDLVNLFESVKLSNEDLNKLSEMVEDKDIHDFLYSKLNIVEGGWYGSPRQKEYYYEAEYHLPDYFYSQTEYDIPEDEIDDEDVEGSIRKYIAKKAGKGNNKKYIDGIEVLSIRKYDEDGDYVDESLRIEESMSSAVERQTLDYKKTKGQIQCNGGAQAKEVEDLLKAKYDDVTTQKGKGGKVIIKFSKNESLGEGLEEDAFKKLPHILYGYKDEETPNTYILHTRAFTTPRQVYGAYSDIESALKKMFGDSIKSIDHYGTDYDSHSNRRTFRVRVIFKEDPFSKNESLDEAKYNYPIDTDTYNELLARAETANAHGGGEVDASISNTMYISASSNKMAGLSLRRISKDGKKEYAKFVSRWGTKSLEEINKELTEQEWELLESLSEENKLDESTEISYYPCDVNDTDMQRRDRVGSKCSSLDEAIVQAVIWGYSDIMTEIDHGLLDVDTEIISLEEAKKRAKMKVSDVKLFDDAFDAKKFVYEHPNMGYIWSVGSAYGKPIAFRFEQDFGESLSEDTDPKSARRERMDKFHKVFDSFGECTSAEYDKAFDLFYDASVIDVVDHASKLKSEYDGQKVKYRFTVFSDDYKNSADIHYDPYQNYIGVVVDNKKVDEDTVKQGSSWVNKGKEGTHGKFKTKKEADAQRKAMFARGFKEGVEDTNNKKDPTTLPDDYVLIDSSIEDYTDEDIDLYYDCIKEFCMIDEIDYEDMEVTFITNQRDADDWDEETFKTDYTYTPDEESSLECANDYLVKKYPDKITVGDIKKSADDVYKYVKSMFGEDAQEEASEKLTTADFEVDEYEEQLKEDKAKDTMKSVVAKWRSRRSNKDESVEEDSNKEKKNNKNIAGIEHL